jgi:8-oxo-dGTP diphosphatase
VDVANVMGSRPDGWWRDRAGAAARLYGEIARLAASGRVVLPGAAEPADDAEFVLVLEGAAKAAAPRIRAAPDAAAAPDAEAGPDAAAPAAGPDAGTAVDTQDAEDAKAGRIRVVEAPRSGDDTIVALVRELNMRRAVVVVTADRELGDRCRAAGATVLGPGWLLRLLGP